MTERLPYFRTFPGDWWRRTNGLSVEAKGFYADLRCLMADSQKFGYLARNSGGISIEKLAKMTGITLEKTSLLLEELMENSTIEQDKDGVFFDPDMVKEESIRLKRKEAGAAGAFVRHLPEHLLKKKSGKRSAFAKTTVMAKGPANAEYEYDYEHVNEIEDDSTRGSAEWGNTFDQFWDAYPRKTGKGAALRIWEKLKPDDDLTEIILKSIVAHCQCRQWTKENGQYIPHPSTWLNQRRWEDEVQDFGGTGNRAVDVTMDTVRRLVEQERKNEKEND